MPRSSDSRKSRESGKASEGFQAPNAPTIHSDNRQVILHNAESGVAFQAALTHVEHNGRHLIVTATLETHQRALQNFAAHLIPFFANQCGTSVDQVDYYERSNHSEAPALRVDVKSLGEGPDAHGLPEQHKVRGTWVREEDLQKLLGAAKLPHAAPDQDLSQLAIGMTQEMRQQAKQEFQQSHRARPLHQFHQAKQAGQTGQGGQGGQREKAKRVQSPDIPATGGPPKLTKTEGSHELPSPSLKTKRGH